MNNGVHNFDIDLLKNSQFLAYKCLFSDESIIFMDRPRLNTLSSANCACQCTSMSQPENTNDPPPPPHFLSGMFAGWRGRALSWPAHCLPAVSPYPARPSPPRPRLGFLGLPLSFPLDKHWPARPAPGNQTLARAGHTQYEYLTFNPAKYNPVSYQWAYDFLLGV